MESSDLLAHRKDYHWVGDAALSLAVRHLLSTRYSGLAEVRARAATIVSNRFITQNTAFGKGDQFEAWVAERFLAVVSQTPEWKQFISEIEETLVLKHTSVARLAQKQGSASNA